MSNGAKYGAPDGVVVDVSAHGDEAWVCVFDRGLGLAGIDTEDLFQPFYRAPAAQELAGGAGLGLAAARRAVAALGGRMWASARDGGGAEFGFSLPLAEASVPAFRWSRLTTAAPSPPNSSPAREALDDARPGQLVDRQSLAARGLEGQHRTLGILGAVPGAQPRVMRSVAEASRSATR